MKRLILFILSASCSIITSAHAFTVIDGKSDVYQFEQKQKPKDQPKRKEYYDSQGRYEGYSRKGFGNRTEHYDEGGRSEGHSERNFMGEVDHYDKHGRYQGSTKDRTF